MAEQGEQLQKSYEIVVANVGAGGVSSQERIGLTAETDELTTPNNCVEPPLPLEQLQRLTESSGTRAGCIAAMVTNTVGLGYALEPTERNESPTEFERRAAEVRGWLEGLARRDTRLERPSFTALMSAVKTDQEEVGNGYMEVSRDRRSGRISGLFHVPGVRMRRLRSRTGWVLLPEAHSAVMGDRTRFYNFGEKVAYNRAGEPQPRLRRSGMKWDVNEVIHFRVFTTRSRDYGLPRDYANTTDYLLDRLASEANVGFFGSGGVPAHVIFVRGEETKEGERVTFRVPPETPQRIAQTLTGDGRKDPSRVAIVPLPPGTEVDDVQLGKVSDQDVGHVDFRGDLRRRKLAAFRISPIFIADTEDAGRYTAEVERAITLEQVFDPDQQLIEERLFDSIFRDEGNTWLNPRFNELAVEGNAVKRESAGRMGEAGTITRGEHREAHGYRPLPEAAAATEEIEWHGETYQSAEPADGEVPHGWNARLVDTGRPRGAENRTDDADDQRGLRPGLAGRDRRSEPPEGIERRSRQAARGLEGAMGRATRRSRRRAARES